MALVLIDRAQETATAVTTVSFVLTGASTGYQSLAAVGNGNTTYYGATDGTNWEVGIGTYSTTGPTLTRDTILSSSNSGSAVTFTGSVTVWVDYPAGRAVYGPVDAASVTVGINAGIISQGTNSIAIGNSAGEDTQGAYAIAIGGSAGLTAQGNNAIAIGDTSGNASQGIDAIAIGTSAGQNTKGLDAVAIGFESGLDTQGAYAVAIGFSSGNATQGTGAVAIGKNAGLTAQGANAVAIGINAAQGAQPGVNYVSGGVSSTTLVVDDTTFLTPGMVVTGGIGWTSNQYIVSITNPTTLVMSAVADSTPTGTIFFTAKQSDNAIAIGFEAGKNSQGSNTFAAGTNAGGINQGNFAVALGESSGTVSQGIAAIAIGSGAGTNNQGATAIAIGSGAGDTNQPAHSIIINASGSILDGTNAGLYIDPVRNDTVSTTNAVYYNTTSKELTYGPASSGGSPASPSTSVQFNNAGAFGGYADFTWDGTTLKPLNVQATTGGVYAASTFTSTFTDGIVLYPLTGHYRHS